jgi:hypothetical protein
VAERPSNNRPSTYERIRSIDGRHPFREALPGGFVAYSARRRHDGEVVYFNFALAREMGVISARHPDRINRELCEALLDTFCLVIVNEHDRLHPDRIPTADILPHTYMATRYLQLQHPGRRGLTSGDGRSIWNGLITHRGTTWDVSSCGTGVTCLCPATGQQGEFFATGGDRADYACGTATEEEGVGAVLTSEIFRTNGIETERVLAVIATTQGQAINVRAARNLLRPAHMFLYARQNDCESLEAVVNLFIDRQVANGDWPAHLARVSESRANRRERYEYLAEEIARTFARISATFESEYIFCWIDWDGDNILADGGIIDYGSIRQFGLYHRDYRYDDSPRWSTSIPEQRRKARGIAQSFAQIRDYLITGRKSPMTSFAHDPVLALFDSEFRATRDRLLLHHVGFGELQREHLLEQEPELVEKFRRAHAHFEHAQSRQGPHRTADGLSRDAIFSVRDLLGQLPEHYCREPRPIPVETFMEICTSDYAAPEDRRLTPHRRRMARAFQRHYLELVVAAARHSRRSVEALLSEISQRAPIINRYDRVTGDSLTYATQVLIHNRRHFSTTTTLHHIIHRYVELQSQDPDRAPKPGKDARRIRCPSAKAVLDTLIELQDEFRHGL